MHVLLASIPSSLFDIGVPIWEKVLRTVAVYVGLVLLLRIGGKRDLAQLNTLDLVVLLLLSNVVQNAIIGPDDSLVGGLLGAAVLLAVNGAVERSSRRNAAAGRLLEGTSSVLIEDGRYVDETMRDLGLRPADVDNALRHQGASSVDEVAEAVLEPGGSIVVGLKPEAVNATRGDLAKLEAKLDRLLAGS